MLQSESEYFKSKPEIMTEVQFTGMNMIFPGNRRKNTTQKYLLQMFHMKKQRWPPEKGIKKKKI